MILIFVGCASKKDAATNSQDAESSTMSYDLEKAEMNLSLSARMFINDLNRQSFKKHNENYYLPEDFIKKYGINKSSHGYSIGGFAKINEKFNEAALRSLNIEVNSSSGDIVTLEIPLKSLGRFLKYNGIDYFELNQRIDYE